MTAALILLVAALLLPWWAASPIRGVYLIFGAALVFEIFPMNFPDSLTDNVPLFLNLNNSNSAGFDGLPITPAEILIMVAVIIWIVAGRSAGALQKPRPLMLGAYVAYIAVVFGAEMRGLISGGDFNISLWELRPQIYGFILFVLAASLVRERKHLLTLGAIFFAAVGFKAILGFYRYFVTLGGDLGTRESILSHEESYFLGLFLVGTIAVLLWYRRWRFALPVLFLSPLVAVVLLENRRRVGMLALWLGLALLVSLAIRYEATMRKVLVPATVVAVVIVVGFMAANWNHGYGTIGQIVRPVHSLFEPDPRDALSNAYRDAENANILISYQSSPVIGMGFGRPMIYVYPMADISNIYPLWNFIPHNTLLWIGMRMGTIGYIVLFGLLGTALLEATWQMRTRSDPLLRGVAAFAIIAIVAELMVGWGDLQLENYRNMIFLGTMLGVINALPRIPDAVPRPHDA